MSIKDDILGNKQKPTATTPQMSAQAQAQAVHEQKEAPAAVPYAANTIGDNGATRTRINPGGSQELQSTRNDEVASKQQNQEEQPPRQMTMEEIFQATNPNPILTPEDEKRQEARRKRRKIFSAISDGISSIANLYATSQYAPNAKTPSLSAQERARWMQEDADRAAKVNAYINGLQQARLGDASLNYSNLRAKKMEEDEKRAAAEEQRKQAQEEYEKEMRNLDKQLKEKQITKADFDAKKSEAQAKKSEAEAQYAGAVQRSIINKNNRQGRSSSGGGSGSSGGSGKYYGQLLGKRYTTKADYENAVMTQARKYGVKLYETVSNVKNGLPDKETKRKPIEQIAAEVNEKYYIDYTKNANEL